MSTIASRDLRNHTADVLRRVADGDRVTVTVHGEPVAELTPPRAERRHAVTAQAFVSRLTGNQADPGLRDDLARLAGETTDDLGPVG
ncbi:MAG: type II toxin-antitoxin system prevent-host-death family antitoxin [Actinomycetia bacterium]|nr:type II toxin-antitoxin system prevent-host-death family antitoxin [Actinomycetes bacterium]